MPDDVAYKPLEELKPIYQGGTLTPPKFMPTYYEWLAHRSLPFIQGGSLNTAGTYSVYTVPVGYSLFLTNVHLNICDAAGSTQVILYMADDSVKKLLTISCKTGNDSTDTINYPIPLKLDSKEQILLSVLANSFVTQYGIVGYLVKKKDLLTF